MNDKDWWNDIFWSSDDDWQREDAEIEDAQAWMDRNKLEGEETE